MSLTESLATLAVYNVGYALPFVVVPAMVAISGESAKPLLQRINDLLIRASDILMPWMFGLLGLALLADSVAYFYGGEGLWQFWSGPAADVMLITSTTGVATRE